LPQQASKTIRWIYCLALLGAILPFGMSGWVAATLGPSPTLFALPYLGPVLFLAFGVWRIYGVARDPDLLDTYGQSRLLKILRGFGIFLMVLAVLSLVLRFSAGPIVRSFVPQRSENGIEYYIFGVYLGILAGTGASGIVLFELSRLLGFERHVRDA
jgi:hypothetical protein